VQRPAEDAIEATKKKPAELKIRLLRMPKKHKGKIPATVIDAAVKQVVAEWRAQPAVAAAEQR
jgi:hypothetical protein